MSLLGSSVKELKDFLNHVVKVLIAFFLFVFGASIIALGIVGTVSDYVSLSGLSRFLLSAFGATFLITSIVIFLNIFDVFTARKLICWQERLKTIEKRGEKIVTELENRINELAISEESLREQKKINFVVKFSLSYYLSDILKAIYNKEVYEFGGKEDQRRNLRFLRHCGYLHHFETDKLEPGENLSNKLRLTPAGECIVELRKKSDLLKEKS